MSGYKDSSRIEGITLRDVSLYLVTVFVLILGSSGRSNRDQTTKQNKNIKNGLISL